MIEARLPDGTALQFEDGTPDAVIDRTVKSHLQSAQPQPSASEEMVDVAGEGTMVVPRSQTGRPPITSLEDARDLIQRGDMAALQYLKPAPDENAITSAAKKAAMVGVHGGATLLQFPINALLGLTQGPRVENGQISVPALTTNPQSGAPALTPEASATVSLAATPLQFGPRGPVPAAGSVNRLLGQDATVTGVRPVDPAVAARAEGRDAFRVAQGEAPPATSQTGEFIPQPPQRPSTPQRGATEPEAGAPQPVGAQVTTSPIPEKTPAQRITDLEKTVTQTAEDRAGPQMRDDTQYVEGIPPRPLASREFHPRNSGDEKRAIGKDDAFRKEIEDIRRQRNEGMVDKLRQDAGDANALDVAHEARQQVSPAELGVFENEQPTSVAGLAARIDKLLSGPEGKQRAVRTTLEDVKKSLYDAEGNLETLPSRIYGARKNLTDLLKRGAKGVGDVADDVRASKHVLEGLLSDFDAAISRGANRFSEYLDQWSALSKPIDQMEFLQQYQTGSKKITDKDGYLIPTKVQKMLDDILQGHKAKGVNKAKSLTDEQIARIEAVRNELAADSLKDRMAAVKGSDTFQQFMQEAKAPGRIATGLKIAGELGIGIPTAGLGNFVLQRGLGHLERRALAKAAAEDAARKRELLSPPNPLMGPLP